MPISDEIRPNILNDVLGQDHIVKRLNQMVESNNFNWPHMMFAGQAGVGKTSTAIALMRTAFGASWKENWLELNASDERSISVIRTKVKEFASRGVIGSYTIDGEEKPIPFNVVFLDEADNLTPDAQAALRRIMEKYSKTIFIISCNYPHKIIQPIQDRCAFSTSRFKPIDDETMSNFILSYAKKTKCEFTEEALQRTIQSSNGSLRTCVNLLQIICLVPGEIVIEDVEDIVQTIKPKEAKKILTSIAKAKTLDAYRKIDKDIDNLISQGMMPSDILHSIYKLTTIEEKMPDKLRHKILTQIGTALHHVSVSQDPALALKCFVRNLTM